MDGRAPEASRDGKVGHMTSSNTRRFASGDASRPWYGEVSGAGVGPIHQRTGMSHVDQALSTMYGGPGSAGPRPSMPRIPMSGGAAPAIGFGGSAAAFGGIAGGPFVAPRRSRR